MRNRLLIAIALGGLLVSVSSGQQPAPSPQPVPAQERSTQTPRREEDEVVRITTNLVQVDAVVTENGKPVTDLKPEEVQIFEDGRAQKVTHFSYVFAETAPSITRASAPSSARPATVGRDAPVGPVARLRPEDVRRTIALVVDDLGLSFQSTYYVRRALKKFVDEQMQPGDLVAIVRTSGGIGALQQFASDKQRLYAAIEHIRWYAGGRAGIGAFAPIVPATPGRFGAEIDATNEELTEFRDDLYAVGTLGAISYVVTGLHDLPGRKSIVLISDGFTILNRAPPTRDVGLEKKSRNERTMQTLQQLIDQANRAGVVIYTMNATGIQTFSLSAEDNLGGRSRDETAQVLNDRRTAGFDTQAGLDYLAEQTGGIAIRNTNDLAGGIRKIVDNEKGYYLIGYRPDQSTFDPKTGRRTFHHLALKVTRPGKFTVRMRNGFYGMADEARSMSRTPREQILGALFSPFGAAGVHTQLTSLFANDAKTGSFMRSMLYVDAKDLTFKDEPDGWHKATFDVVAVTFGDGSNFGDQFNHTDELRVRDDTYQQVLRDGFVYFLSYPIKKPGAYQMRTVLRDHESERVGSASQFVEVPDLKKGTLALSGIVLRGVNLHERGKAASSGSGPNAGSSGQKDSDPSSQSAESNETVDPRASEWVRHFPMGTLMRYRFVIYNARLNKDSHLPQLQVQTRLFRGGQSVFTGRVQPFSLNNPPDLTRLVAESAIQLGPEMVPGEYVLQVIVTDLLADEKHRAVNQWIDFEVMR
jgi:VWFA-related protein